MKHKHYDVLIAIAEGKEVECKISGEWEWVNARFSLYTPLEDSSLEWRIKPDMDDVITEKFNKYWAGADNGITENVFKAGFLAGVQACQNGEYY